MMELTQKQYDKIKDALPVQRGNVRVDNLTFLNAILYVTENGCEWRKIREMAHDLSSNATLGG